jgi:hypothetical protein
MFVESHKPSLFPSFDLRERELRNVCVLFRIFELVPSFASDLFREVDVRVSTKTKTEYLTEVVFEAFQSERPDGYVRIGNWQAIVEAKSDSKKLNPEQIAKYVEIARQKGFDAVLTISNEMVARPDHHPCYEALKAKTRKVGLFHFSWQHIFTRICLWVESEGRLDPEQVVILRDFRDFLGAKNSGLNRFTQMSPSWRGLLEDVRKLSGSQRLSLSSENANAVLRDWFFEERYVGLQLSEHLKAEVKLHVPRKYLGGSGSIQRFDDALVDLTQDLTLQSQFIVPNAADNLRLKVDLGQKKIEVSMWLQAPKDVPTTKGRIGWLMRMLADVDQEFMSQILVHCSWRGKSGQHVFSLSEIKSWKGVIPRDLVSVSITYFEIKMICDDSVGFRSPIKFVQKTELLVHNYYQQVGERLKKWVPKPPKHDEQAVI